MFSRPLSSRIGSVATLKKTFAILLAVLFAASLLVSCGTVGETEVGANLEKSAVEIILNGDTAVCDSSSVFVGEDGKITVTAAGTYLITGELNDGMIYVECVDAGVLTLVFKGASITNDNGPCLQIRKAQQAVITLYEGTTNTFSDGMSYDFDNPDDTEPDSAIYSKEDLTVNGTGTMVINGNYSNGLTSKDSLKIDNGTLEINAVRHGIKGKDKLVINGGDITVNAMRDGIKSTNYESQLVGYVEINGGSLTIMSEDEAIQAITAVNFNGGTVTVGSTNNGIKCDGSINFNGGEVTIDVEDNALNAYAISKKDECTVTISGIPYNG